jgi:hypothetical protein
LTLSGCHWLLVLMEKGTAGVSDHGRLSGLAQAGMHQLWWMYLWWDMM